MKTLLVISRETRFAAAIGAGLDADEWRVRTAPDVAAACESAGPAILDAVVIDDPGAELAATVGMARRAFPDPPVVVAVDDASSCDAALEAGATIALPKPFRVGLLSAWLKRQTPRVPWVEPGDPPASGVPASRPRPLQALANIAELSGVIARVLEPEALAREFLLHVRGIVGCNRAAIFLREADGDSLACAFATGLPGRGDSLRLASGIGAELVRGGRVLRRDGVGAEARRELAGYGAEYAIPILDRQNLVGVALLDRSVAGHAFEGDELTLLFRAFEVLGLALARSRQHEAMAAAEALAIDVFDTLDTASVVVAPDLTLVHVNPAARRQLGLADQSVLQDLPAPIAAKVFGALRDGAKVPPFRHVPTGGGGRVYEVKVKPVAPSNPGERGAVLVTIEDATEIEQSGARERAGGRAELLHSMAGHLAHEIGNTLVPLSTGQQLMTSGEVDAGAMRGLKSVFGDSVRRIERLAGQMQLLSRDGLRDVEEVTLGVVLREAFAAAGERAGTAEAEVIVCGDEALVVMAERKGLQEALTEILLNALQAAGTQRVEVGITRADEGIEIDVRDGGPGFRGDDLTRATEPFYSGRAVGPGLGLTVARRMIELHGGRLQPQPARKGKGGCIRVVLPQQDPTSSA